MESETTEITYTIEMLGLKNQDYVRILSDKVGDDVKSLQSMDIGQLAEVLKCDLGEATQIKDRINTTIQGLTFMMPRNRVIKIFSNAWMAGMVRSYKSNSGQSERIKRIRQELG